MLGILNWLTVERLIGSTRLLGINWIYFLALLLSTRAVPITIDETIFLRCVHTNTFGQA
jgi:hypothetical protein